MIARPVPRPVALVLMGVSGCGKTSVAEALEARLGWPRAEGDALRPPANVARMAAGQALDDAGRAPLRDPVRRLPTMTAIAVPACTGMAMSPPTVQKCAAKRGAAADRAD